ncbi:hypothetical protein C8R27_11938 [Nitrosomonas ureae]|uniref:DUF6988 family protein n=1 Tax=Nitrosomonas ureae TaxID=44577 RepID=UPI000D76EE30|nr:hypothetical protein [Nitrosomonas ureae]PXX13729.1 hypothetical protein C8R27_11938 [Nitrosomonas ureae]
MTHNKIIEIAKELATWIHEHTNQRNYPDNPGLKLLQQSQDICDAITILIDSNLPGPAFALARPLLDSYARGLWLLNYASEEEAEMFLAGKPPGFDKLLETIGNDEKTGGAWLHKISELNRSAFHDLTHGGIEHVLRRTTISFIEPNYPEEEQIRLMQFQIEIQFAIGANLLAISNHQVGIEKLEVMAQHYRLAARGI